MKPKKPLGQKAYGSIPHLPGSRRGPADRGLSERQAAILTDRIRDELDCVFVEEKLDGSNCAVAKLNGEIVALVRAGYRAETSPYEQHHRFKEWVNQNAGRFRDLLFEGERCVGECMLLAHGTRYDLPHEPFVIFDLMVDGVRACREELWERCEEFVTPFIIHVGDAMSIESAMRLLDGGGHGATDPPEGAVWRVERKGQVDFLAKFVKTEKVDGSLLPEMNDGVSIWNPFKP